MQALLLVMLVAALGVGGRRAFLPPAAYLRWVEGRARVAFPPDAVTAGG